MWSILQFVAPKTNWGILNINNYYNFIVSIFELIENDKRKIFISNMKLIIGLSFTKSFKLYVYQKDPDNDILKYL